MCYSNKCITWFQPCLSKHLISCKSFFCFWCVMHHILHSFRCKELHYLLKQLLFLFLQSRYFILSNCNLIQSSLQPSNHHSFCIFHFYFYELLVYSSPYDNYHVQILFLKQTNHVKKCRNMKIFFLMLPS
jgi:hypothetical protein